MSISSEAFNTKFEDLSKAISTLPVLKDQRSRGSTKWNYTMVFYKCSKFNKFS